MIIKFFRHGKGKSEGCINYLLGKDREREKAQVMRGSVALTSSIIDSSPYIKKYTSGCLSFYEKNIDKKDKFKIMDDFEKILFPGLNREQYNILWIEHTDKDRLELNFVIPNIEITTGKRLNPFYAPTDLKRIDLYKKFINFKYNLHGPDLAIPLLKKIRENTPKKTRDVVELIGSLVELGIKNGNVYDRKSLINYLTENNLNVVRQVNKSISIKHPEFKRNIRLEGLIYESEFKTTRLFEIGPNKRTEENRKSIQRFDINDRESLRREVERKGKWLLERYQQKPRKMFKDTEELRQHFEKSNVGNWQIFNTNRRGQPQVRRYQNKGKEAEVLPFYEFHQLYDYYTNNNWLFFNKNGSDPITEYERVSTTRGKKFNRDQKGFRTQQESIYKTISGYVQGDINDDRFRETIINNYRRTTGNYEKSARSFVETTACLGKTSEYFATISERFKADTERFISESKANFSNLQRNLNKLSRVIRTHITLKQNKQSFNEKEVVLSDKVNKIQSLGKEDFTHKLSFEI
jgi:hypothetical protein